MLSSQPMKISIFKPDFQAQTRSSQINGKPQKYLRKVIQMWNISSIKKIMLIASNHKVASF